MEFSTYNFDNNGDIEGVTSDNDFVYVGRFDSDGDLSLEDEHASLESEIRECLFDTLRRCLPGQPMSGDLDWTPDVCFLKAVGWEESYAWDEDNNEWIEAREHKDFVDEMIAEGVSRPVRFSRLRDRGLSVSAANNLVGDDE